MTPGIYLPKFDISVPQPIQQKPPKIYIPYTYWLYLVPEDLYYYGSQYTMKKRKPAHPFRFWNNYHTSSKVIKELREQYDDEKDWRFFIAKTFYTATATESWEAMVLQFFDAKNNPRFINKHNNEGVQGLGGTTSEQGRAGKPLYFPENYQLVIDMELQRLPRPHMAQVMTEKIGELVTESNLAIVVKLAKNDGLLPEISRAEVGRIRNPMYKHLDFVVSLWDQEKDCGHIARVMTGMMGHPVKKNQIKTMLSSAVTQGMTVWRKKKKDNFMYQPHVYKMVIEEYEALGDTVYRIPELVAKAVSARLGQEVTKKQIDNTLTQARQNKDIEPKRKVEKKA